uniref:PHD-type domain-containing protein n=1 Tax=Romanomermis culicivorax TaxID=13658 RepID=A0A915HZ87_ROMCU
MFTNLIISSSKANLTVITSAKRRKIVLLNILTRRERSMAHTKSRKGSTTTQSAINTHQVNDANCTICASIGQDKDRAILCNYYNNWFHCKCANTGDQVYDYLKASNQVSFCPSCLPAVNQFLKLNKWFADLENHIPSLEKELVAKITDLEQKLEAAQQKSTVPPVYSIDFLVSIGKNTLEAEAKKDTALFLNFRTDDNDDLLSEVKDFTKSISFEIDYRPQMLHS